jgi:DNA-directed RNA polymerase specialized sigma24 family protein
VLKFRRRSEEYMENAAGILYERFLTRVFQYMIFWVNDAAIAEELTLKALKEVLANYEDCSNDEKEFSIRIFNCARSKVLDYLKVNSVKPVLSGLSAQEQDVISLRLAGEVNNRTISKLLGLSEIKTGKIVCRSLNKLSDRHENCFQNVL